MLDDGIHTLAYGHKDITKKVESVREGREQIIMTFDEAVKNGLKPSYPVDPTLIQPRARRVGVWEKRRRKRVHDARKCQSAEMHRVDGDSAQESDESEGDETPAKRTTTHPNDQATVDPTIQSNKELAAVEASISRTPNTPITFSPVFLPVPQGGAIIHEEAFRLNGGADELLSTLSDSDSDSDSETGFEFM